MKFFYVVTHSVPYPITNGGIWNVIAENDDECFDLISNHDEYLGYGVYLSQLRENIINAEKFVLASNEDSRIVDVFVSY